MPKHQTIEQLRRSVAEAAADWVESELARSAESAIQLGYAWDSPIEERLFLGLSIAAQEQHFAVELYRSRRGVAEWRLDAPDESPVWSHPAPAVPEMIGFSPADVAHYVKDYASSRPAIRLYPQVHVDKYRLDFLVEWSLFGFFGHIRRAAIECDGHDFHERTKEQALRDRTRDREIQAFGLPVLRFTGSEIHRDSVDLGRQILNFFQTAEDRELQAELTRDAAVVHEPPKDGDG